MSQKTLVSSVSVTDDSEDFKIDNDLPDLDKLQTEILNGNEPVVQIRDICVQYGDSPVGSLRDFLMGCLKLKGLSIYLKVDIAQTLHRTDKNDALLIGLVQSPEFRSSMSNYQLEVLLSLSDDKTTRGCIQYLLNKSRDDKEYFSILRSIRAKNFPDSVSVPLFLIFIHRKGDVSLHQILACEHLLVDPSLSGAQALRDDVFRVLTGWTGGDSMPEELKANIADLLLEFDETLEEGRRILEQLGGGSYKNVYHNRQNVHNNQIKKSAYNILSMLQKHQPDVEDNKDYSTETVIQDVAKLGLSSSGMNALELMQQRDRPVIGTLTLVGALRCLWYYIQHSKNKDILTERLVEELEDMNKLCFSGFSIRMANVLSGIEDQQLSISFQDQIKANVSGRLNACLRFDPQKEDIVCEMANDLQETKPKYNEFFIKHISNIREDLYREFVGGKYVTDAEFVEAFRHAVIHVQDGISTS